MTDGKAKSLVAYHEVGHAICGYVTSNIEHAPRVVEALECCACSNCLFEQPAAWGGASRKLVEVAGLF